MSMATLQLYKNPYTYPEYGNITSYGSSMSCTPVGTGLKSGTISTKGNMADFMSCNYLALTRDGKTFYAWIDDVTHATANSFNVSYTVDAWRTYRSKINLGNQFISRSPSLTYLKDDMLGAITPYPEIETKAQAHGQASKRVFVVQVRVATGAAYSRSPVQPTPYQFFMIEYSLNNWLDSTPLLNLMIAMSGAQPENIVTMYSIPHIDISSLPAMALPVRTADSTTEIEGFRFLSNSIAPNTLLTVETPIILDYDVNELMRVDHSVQIVIPEAGIINLTDEMLGKGDLTLRQDIDLFSGASNYMIKSGTSSYYSASVRGSSISSIPIVSDPLDTYLSQNQNALATSLIGDVASIAGGLGATAMTGGLGAAIGAGTAAGGVNSIINRMASQRDMANQYSNPPAFLGTALASNFNQIFWIVTTKQKVDNATTVHDNFGYPFNMISSLDIPSNGYIKTEGCAVSSTDGSVPRWAIQEINNNFDNGIYFH